MKDYSVIGKRVVGIDKVKKVTGAAEFTADLSLPGMLYGKVLRSPYAHARIVSIDTSEAERLSGVKAVVTGQEIPRVKFGLTKEIRDQYLLAIDKVRYVGEEVAGVAAVNEDIAEEALNLINVEYEELPAVFDAEAAMKEGAPALHAHVERNISPHNVFHFGDVDKAFEECDYIYIDRLTDSKTSHGQMEPYAALAAYDPSSEMLDMWAPNQSPFTRRRALSNALQMPLVKIRYHNVHMGGAFGGLSDTFPSDFIAALLSIKAARPVRLEYTREETMKAIRHWPSVVVEMKIGVKRDGTILAKDCKLTVDGGAYMSSSGLSAFQPYMHLESLYRVPNVRYEGTRAYTNKTACSMHRLHAYQIVMLDEMMLENIAKDLGLDPVEMRKKHATQPGDILAGGTHVTSFALTETIDKAVGVSGWREKKGKLPPGRGIGIACSGSYAGFGMGFRLNSSASVKFNEDGSCSLFSGNVDNGQGNESMLIQIASEVLGIQLERMDLICGDTALTPQDPGTYSMTSAFVSGNAVLLAATDAKQQIIEMAATMIGVPASELEVKESRVFVQTNPEKSVRVEDVVREAWRRGTAIEGRGSYTPLPLSEHGWVDQTTPTRGQRGATYTDGTTVAEVEVDRETGVVKVLNLWQAYDCGFALNPMAVEGQWQGAAGQMLGKALMEEHVWDEKGRLVTDSFLEYRMPRSLDVPKVSTTIVESIDPRGPFGAKEVGINAGGGVAAAIANGIHDAVGVWVKQLPITPDKILVALEEKERGKVS
jgi:4-hydroxybenzoyl-CoA reductase alpha subunit